MEGDIPDPKIKHADGVTPAERYLQQLCEKSFLSLWSYCGLYKDQKASCKGNGKELCDLLVVFGDDVLVFSDKNCAFKDTGNIGVDWCRWYRKSIADSAQQAWHAGPFLKLYPDRIYLDAACKEKFPLTLPSPERIRLHYIVVTHSIDVHVRKHFGGGSGSLVFNSDLTEPSHYENNAQLRPFEVGWLNDKRPFVHVLHDYSLEVVLKTLDTITDFVEYLRAKEALLEDLKQADRRLMYFGEEDLLANYMRTMKDGAHGFNFPDEVQNIMLGEGQWLTLVSHPKFLARHEANKISYYWDYIIERFTTTISKNYQPGATFDTQEKALRFLAREGRVRRRMLSEEIYKMLQTTPEGHDRRRVSIPDRPGEPYYVFLLAGRPPYIPAHGYQEYRQNSLWALCNIAKTLYPDAEDIVGFATEAGFEAENVSEDLTWLDARKWSKEDQDHWSSVQKETGFLSNAKMAHISTVEFPDPNPERAK